MISNSCLREHYASAMKMVFKYHSIIRGQFFLLLPIHLLYLLDILCVWFYSFYLIGYHLACLYSPKPICMLWVSMSLSMCSIWGVMNIILFLQLRVIEHVNSRTDFDDTKILEYNLYKYKLETIIVGFLMFPKGSTPTEGVNWVS